MREREYGVIEGYIVDYIRQQVGNGELDVDPGSNFVEEGLLDSFAILSLVMGLESRFGIKFQADDLIDPSVQAISGLAALVCKKTGGVFLNDKE